MNENGQEWENLFQMTIVSTTMGKNPLEEILFAVHQNQAITVFKIGILLF